MEVGHKKFEPLLAMDFPSFSAVLPYRYYDEGSGCFINESSIGFGFEIAPLVGADEVLIKSLASLFQHKIPDGYELQWVLWGSQQVGQLLSCAYPERSTQTIGGDLEKEAEAYYARAAQQGFYNPRRLPMTLRDYRVFCFVSLRTSYSESVLQSLVNVRSDLESDFLSSALDFRRLDVEDFLRLLTHWIQYDTKSLHPSHKRYRGETTLNDQMIKSSFELEHEPTHLITRFEHQDQRIETEIVSLSMEEAPDTFALWMSADNFYNVFRASQAIRCPFIISFHCRLIPSLKAKTMAQKRFLSLEKKARSAYAKYISGTLDAANEWKAVRDQLNQNDYRLAETFYNVVLFTNTKDRKEDQAAAIGSYRCNGFELTAIRYQQLQSYLATLPFIVSEGLWNDLRRTGRLKTLTSWNATNLLPIVADYKLGRQGIPLATFRNQLALFDPFDPSLPISNTNICITGTSGSGKSLLVQMIERAVLTQGGKCWVIDLGESQHKFCSMMQGVYLEASQLSLNPFSFVRDIQEDGERIRDFMVVLASGDEPGKALDVVQQEYLRQAVELAWQGRGRQAEIDDVVAALVDISKTKNDPRAEDIVTLLKKYQRNEAYGKIFNETSDLSPDKNFVVLELGKLKNKPSLLKAVLFAFMLYIEEQMYHLGRDIPKMAVIDEAWLLLGGDDPVAARFIETGFRTSRKHKGAFVAIMQGLEDFRKGAQAQSAWNCSQIKVTMLQDAKGFKDFVQQNPNEFSPYEECLIKGFQQAKTNGFSEFMLEVGSVKSFYRLIVDPFTRVMLSTDGDEFSAVQKHRANGMTMEAAILSVAKVNYAHEFASDL